MLIFRYLAKEVFITLVSLTTILLLIFMSNQFVRYLNRVASGEIPLAIIMKLMMLELPNLIGLLLPLGFYIALLVAYGRLYADSEMTVLQACGYGPNQLLRHSYFLALLVSVTVLIIMLWASPYIAKARTTLLKTTGVQTLIQTIVPGRFTAVSRGREVFYVEKMSRNHTQAEGVFLARQTIKKNTMRWDILWAEKAFAKIDSGNKEHYLILKNGNEYEGKPGLANYQITQFSEYQARLPHPKLPDQNDIRTAKTSTLWPLWNSDRRKAAELQWRLSVPLMVLTLTLVAIPLSRVNPRAGKFAKLLPAILLYIIYANLMFISRDWLIAGKVPLWMGMWWIHLLVLLVGAALLFRNSRHLG